MSRSHLATAWISYSDPKFALPVTCFVHSSIPHLRCGRDPLCLWTFLWTGQVVVKAEIIVSLVSVAASLPMPGRSTDKASLSLPRNRITSRVVTCWDGIDKPIVAAVRSHSVTTDLDIIGFRRCGLG